ncbi:MAG: cupin domain-containing protein [Pseudomonadota bacterium]|nr:cupin domain-containing protein [Pseudomonadota bacterium]
MKNKVFSALVASILLLPVQATGLTCGGPGTQQTPGAYTTPGGEKFSACFDRKAKNVVLQLPDGRVVTLPAAVSASGARYSNGEETFWEHQGTGRYFIGDKLVLEGRPGAAPAYGSGVTARVLAKTTVTGNGQRIVYPTDGQAEVTAMLVEIAPGAETGWHRHSIPVYAYVLAGELTVELEDGKKLPFKAGDAIIEVVNAFHNGRNVGKEQVRLAVFYLGVKGTPNVIKKESP